MTTGDSFEDELIPEAEDTLTSSQQRDSLRFFAWLSFGLSLAIFSLIAGFVYGDRYGRQHAQFDNPQLRDHYAGQCYAYWENQFKQTVRVALERPSARTLEQTQKLNEMRSILADMQVSLDSLAQQKEGKGRRKVARNSYP
jgi:hypothetical protein